MPNYRIIDRHDFGMFGNYAFAAGGELEFIRYGDYASLMHKRLSALQACAEAGSLHGVS